LGEYKNERERERERERARWNEGERNRKLMIYTQNKLETRQINTKANLTERT
jgi:hypothetical protein